MSVNSLLCAREVQRRDHHAARMRPAQSCTEEIFSPKLACRTRTQSSQRRQGVCVLGAAPLKQYSWAGLAPQNEQTSPRCDVRTNSMVRAACQGLRRANAANHFLVWGFKNLI